MIVRSAVRKMLTERLAQRGQQGFMIITGMAIWLLVGGMVMFALMSMTVSAAQIASTQARNAQEIRAVEGALEAGITTVQIDRSGRVSVPADKDGGRCSAPLGDEKSGLVVDDGFGDRATVVATCWGDIDARASHEVQLTARLESGRVVGTAKLQARASRDGGTRVKVLDWSVRHDPTVEEVPSTTDTTSTSTTTTTTTIDDDHDEDRVRWTSRITSDWRSGYCAQFEVTNRSDRKVDWQVEVPVEGRPYDFWNGRYSHRGSSLKVKGEDWNRTLREGESTSFGFCANR